ncbi:MULTISPECIES: hypothetical protein [unclassified Modestobacter]|uniref:hypothetical protein n=1 Tax=unclassified Modestobacter TaxID=2643866 RepID=UPI0022AA0A3C|nr:MULTISPECIES: hypothetical protein [unclassified Modestobacter]MCZ2823439.1 hypothetical protein [Modestobacter sp. VKM Ac-2981]MCZ2851684.1 hypothetical protein [Modestobacter sp. VKM Ac-2982]
MATADPVHPAEEALVFPVGHPMGAFHQHRGEPPSYWVVRLGWDSPLLGDQTTADVWTLTHGVPSRVQDGMPWTRTAVRQAAEEAGVPDCDLVLDALIERGLVAELLPGSEPAAEFARTHRVQSLLLGLGEPPGRPGVDGIGLLGTPASALVGPATYEFWQWAHLWPTLADAAVGLAEMAGQAPDPDPADTDPAAVLDRSFRELHRLLSGNAVYLDRSLAVADAARDAGG